MNDKTISLSQFAQELLGVEVWSKLAEIFEAVESGKRKILIRSCNGAGKTCALAAICNWKLYTQPDSIVLTTASSHTQVRRNLWGEIRKQAKHATLYGKGELREALIKITDKHYAIGIAPNVPENAQGFHAPKMMIVVDEATGVSCDIIKALFGNATGDEAQMILAYNPINTDSYPYEAEQNGDWHQIHISAFDHPNLFGEPGYSGTDFSPSESDGRTKVLPTKKNIKGAVSAKWVADMLPTWGDEVKRDDDDAKVFAFNGKYWRNSGEIAARVFGEWTEDGGEGFIPMHLVTRSQFIHEVRGTRAMGVDIAHGGDETVFAFFDGNVQLPFHSMRTKDLVEVAEKIRQYYKEGWKIIAIDDTGVGAGVSDILKSHGVDFFPVSFGKSGMRLFDTNYRKIANIRAEIYFNVSEELKTSKIKLLNDRKLYQELTAFKITNSEDGKFLLEKKDDLKRRLGRSPDRADATALARYGLRLEGKNEQHKWKRYLI